MLHDIGITDADEWLSDYTACDTAYLRHYYCTGEKRVFLTFWRRGTPIIEAQPIPAFTLIKRSLRSDGFELNREGLSAAKALGACGLRRAVFRCLEVTRPAGAQNDSPFSLGGYVDRPCPAEPPGRQSARHRADGHGDGRRTW